MKEDDVQRLEELEITVSHQAKTLDDLNDVIIKQTTAIDKLQRQLDVLSGRLEEFESNIDGPPASQKPPHW